jgi:hypothetical protein
MHQKLTKNAGYAQKIKKIRSRTVEPVLGTLLNFINMKRVNTRGIRGANKHVMMSALTYNLKKYLNFNRKKAETACRNRFNKREAFFSFEWLVSEAILVLFKIPSFNTKLHYIKN